MTFVTWKIMCKSTEQKSTLLVLSLLTFPIWSHTDSTTSNVNLVENYDVGTVLNSNCIMLELKLN